MTVRICSIQVPTQVAKAKLIMAVEIMEVKIIVKKEYVFEHFNICTTITNRLLKFFESVQGSDVRLFVGTTYGGFIFEEKEVSAR